MRAARRNRQRSSSARADAFRLQDSVNITENETHIDIGTKYRVLF